MTPTVKTKMMNRFISTDVMCKVRHNIWLFVLDTDISFVY